MTPMWRPNERETLRRCVSREGVDLVDQVGTPRREVAGVIFRALFWKAGSNDEKRAHPGDGLRM